MSAQDPPPAPSESYSRRSWRDWLPWVLLGIALAALVGIGIWQQTRIQSLEDDRSELEAELASAQQANQSLSAQAKKAEKNASDLQGTVSAQGDSIDQLRSQLASARSSLQTAQSQLSSEESANQQLQTNLEETTKQLEAAESSASKIEACHEAITAGAAANTDITKAVGQLEGAIRAPDGSTAERTGLAATLRLLDSAEAIWSNVSTQVRACS